MFTPNQAKYLLNLVLKEPVQTNVGEVVKGLRASPDVVAIIIALQNIIKPPAAPTNVPSIPTKAKRPKPNGKTDTQPAR
jgi:hypothetical protein